MGRPRADEHRVPTPERILEAAEAAFGAHPFAAASLADIAATAKVRRPSLLYHFPSKDLLYAAVVDRLFADLIAQMATAAQPRADGAETIDALFVSWMDFLKRRPAFAPLVLRGIIDGQGPVRERLVQQLIPLIDQLETFIQAAGKRPEHISVRAALLQIGTDSLVRAASGPLVEPLWEGVDGLKTVRQLFYLPIPPEG
jgi:AcrR family transcriptional regulator